MIRTLAAAIMINLAVSGFFSKATKGEFMNYLLTQDDYVMGYMKENAKCYNISIIKFQDDMGKAWRDCCWEAREDMPPTISAAEQKAFKGQIGDCLDVKFYLEHEDSLLKLSSFRGDDLKYCTKYIQNIGSLMARGVK